MDDLEESHDHCTACHNKHCDFDIVEGVSCRITSCVNDCGQKLHECKQSDHDIICLNSKITCVNKQYGCPFEMPRHTLSSHLGVCPANVVICMMEWNRWHRGSLQSSNDRKANSKKLKDVPVVHHDLDVALALHDQRVLLETIMPHEVLGYYSELADCQNEERIMINTMPASDNLVKIASQTSELPILKTTENKEIACEQISELALDNRLWDCDDGRICSTKQPVAARPDGLSAKESTTLPNGDAHDFNRISGMADVAQLPITLERSDQVSISDNLRKYVDVIKHKNEAGAWNNDEIVDASIDTTIFAAQYMNRHSVQDVVGCTGNEESNETIAKELCMSGLPYGGLFNQPTEGARSLSHLPVPNGCAAPIEEMRQHQGVLADVKEIDVCIKQFAETAPHFMTLLNALDSDICAVVDTVDHLVSEVAKKETSSNAESHELPVLDWNDNDVGTSAYGDQERHSHQLRQSINDMLKEFGVVCELGLEPSTPALRAEERRQKRRSERRKRSWLYSSGVTGGPFTSWGWNPRKETKDASTDTSELAIDRSNMEWLSPEVAVNQTDLISRLFSIIGASTRGYICLTEHKQTKPFMADSASQTVAPFLLHLDMHAIGRALRSYSLTSSHENHEEREYILSLLSAGHTENMRNDYQPIKMSENLAYYNMSLDSVVESVPRYQTKPSSMFSFMCGCVLRRDQFAAHVQNVHCEIMSGLNGWIEQKCPYAAFGCEYSQPRFCPNNHGDAIVFNQRQNCFAVKPGHWKRSQDCDGAGTSSSINFLDLPLEIIDRIFRFLDNVTINQLSQTCTFIRGVSTSNFSMLAFVNAGNISARCPNTLGLFHHPSRKSIGGFCRTARLWCSICPGVKLLLNILHNIKKADDL